MIAALAMLGPFSIDTFFPAFRVMGAEFGVSPAAMQQTLSVYLAAYALMSLLHGPLSDSYGRRPVILVALAVFAVATAGCALATSFSQLLVFRAIEGVSAGAGLIVGRAIIRDRFEGPDAQRLMSNVTLIFGAAPALAPMLGGLLLSVAGWRSIFWAIAVFSAGLLAYCSLRLVETHAGEHRVQLSVRKLARTYSSMLRDRVFLSFVAATTLNFGALWVYIASAPIFVMDLLHLNERQFAWLFVPAIGGMMIGAAISGRLAGKLTPASTIRLGYRLIAAGALVNVVVNLTLAPQLPWSVLPIGLGSIGIAISFPTITLLLLDRFPLTRGAVSSLQASITLSFNALVSGALTPLIAHSGLSLALTAASLSLAGFGCWRLGYQRLKKAG